MEQATPVPRRIWAARSQSASSYYRRDGNQLFVSIFLREWIFGVAVSVAIVGATFLLGRKAYIDNSHLFITQPHWPKAAVAIALGRSASTVKDCSSSGGLGEL